MIEYPISFYESFLDREDVRIDIELGKVFKVKPSGEEVEIGFPDDKYFYVYHVIDGRKLKLKRSRLVYFAAHCILPKLPLSLDHCDRDKANDSIENLEIKTATGQALNRDQFDSKLKIQGVELVGSSFRAHCTISGGKVRGAATSDLLRAWLDRVSMEITLHGEVFSDSSKLLMEVADIDPGNLLEVVIFFEQPVNEIDNPRLIWFGEKYQSEVENKKTASDGGSPAVQRKLLFPTTKKGGCSEIIPRKS